MIRDNISGIKERIISSCLRAQRDPLGVRVIAVSKGRPVEDIEEALACGITDIGENRVQEALYKLSLLLSDRRASQQKIRWHMVGHLQRNKAKDAVKIFDLIHSVDSLDLAGEIARQAAKINKVQNVLIEIKTSPEKTKFGLSPDTAIEVIKEAANLKSISIKGLMTIAPLSDSPQESRSYFRILRELRGKIKGWELPVLSMGMSDDFEIAIEEGADFIRLGRAIFDK